MRLIETERKNQREKIDYVLKMKLEEVKKLSEQNLTIILEKGELEKELRALETESNLKMIRIKNLESEQIEAASLLDQKRKLVPELYFFWGQERW